MKCNRYQELLMRHFDGDLNNEEQELLQQHLNGCPGCRNLYGDLHHILTPLETAAPVEPHPGLEKMVLERVKKLPVTFLKTAPNGESGLAKMIYGWLAVALVLLMLAIHLALRDAGLYQLFLQSRQYFSFLSGIALDSQIFCQVVSSVFAQVVLSIFREIQSICLAAVLFGIVLTIRFTAVKLAHPKMDLQ